MIMRPCHATGVLLALFTTAMLPLEGNTLPRGSTDTDIIARFDSLARGPLPASIDIPALDRTGARHVSTLVVLSRLRGSATFPGESAATLYDATLDGKVAVVTRSDEALDISIVTEDGVDVVDVGSDTPGIGHTHHVPVTRPASVGEGSPRRRRSVTVTYGFDGDVDQASEPPVAMEMADPLAPLEIRLFMHDDLRSSQARTIHSDYVAWWLRDMESNILPADVSINVVYLQAIPGISDQPYGTSASMTMWRKAIDAYIPSRGIRRTWKNKYVLLTTGQPAEGKLGQAVPATGMAMATVSGPYNVIAHELGHLFGADHAQAEWRLSGWWPCRTNMYFNDTPLLANCYEYAKGNIANIQRYVDLKGYLPPHLTGISAEPPAPAPKATGGRSLGPLLAGNPWQDAAP
jgi:Metallo-peptidase family M12B Reprolysin-like